MKLVKVDNRTTNSPASLSCRVMFPRIPPASLSNSFDDFETDDKVTNDDFQTGVFKTDDFKTVDIKTENNDSLSRVTNTYATRAKIKVTAPCAPRSSSESLLDSPKPTVVKQPRSDKLVNGDLVHPVMNGSHTVVETTPDKKKMAAAAGVCRAGTRRRKKTSRSTAAPNHQLASNQIGSGHQATANHQATSKQQVASNHVACNGVAMVNEGINGFCINGVAELGSPRGRSSSVPAIGTPQSVKPCFFRIIF